MKKRILIDLEPEVYELLTRLAEKEGRKIKPFIEYHLKMISIVKDIKQRRIK
jgi:hypothetical protein